MKKECKGKDGCGLNKDLTEFGVKNSVKSGRSNICIDCSRKRDRIRTTTDKHRAVVNKRNSLHENKDKQKIRNIEYYNIEENRENILKRQFSREYKDRKNELTRIRRKNDTNIRISTLISNNMRQTLKDGKRENSWKDLVDFSIEELIIHLKMCINKLPGFIWKDYMKGKLHLDHIRPISSFNYKSYEDSDFKKCWCLENFQLLPANINIRKNQRWDKTPENVSFNLKYITLAELIEHLDDDIVLSI